jgi:hypothetical protein
MQNFISIGQGVTVWRGPKIACSHRKAESSIILHCTTAHAVIRLKTASAAAEDYFFYESLFTVHRSFCLTVASNGSVRPHARVCKNCTTTCSLEGSIGKRQGTMATKPVLRLSCASHIAYSAIDKSGLLSPLTTTC